MYKKKIFKRIFAIVSCIYILFGVVLGRVEVIQASDFAEAYSAFDIVTSLFASVGITVGVADNDARWTPTGSDADIYDEWVQSVNKELASSGSDIRYPDSYEWAETRAEQREAFISELKDLGNNIKDGAITVSKDLWNYLNSWAHENVSDDSVSDYDISLKDFEIGSVISDLSGLEVSDSYTVDLTQYVPVIAVLNCSDYYDYVVFCCDRSVYSDVMYLSNGSWGSTLYLYYSTLSGGIQGITTKVVFEASSYSATSLSELNKTSPKKDYSESKSIVWVDGVLVDAPDVIWPDLGLAVDQVLHPALTWEDAAAAGDIITQENADDDTQNAVIPLVDTGVGEDVYENTATGDIVTPGDTDTDTGTDTATGIDTVDGTTAADSIVSSINTALDNMGDFKNKFPFCIPWDIVKLVSGFKSPRQIPIWTFTYKFKPINYTWSFTVDMSDYEDYVKIFRAGVTIFWIITLMFITIRWSSGIAAMSH